jgi:hypothetical protein
MISPLLDIQIKGAITEDQLIDPAIALLQLSGV